MFRIRRDGEEAPGTEIENLGMNGKFSLSLEDVDNLLVGMGMGFGRMAGFEVV